MRRSSDILISRKPAGGTLLNKPRWQLVDFPHSCSFLSSSSSSSSSRWVYLCLSNPLWRVLTSLSLFEELAHHMASVVLSELVRRRAAVSSCRYLWTLYWTITSIHFWSNKYPHGMSDTDIPVNTQDVKYSHRSLILIGWVKLLGCETMWNRGLTQDRYEVWSSATIYIYSQLWKLFIFEAQTWMAASQ